MNHLPTLREMVLQGADGALAPHEVDLVVSALREAAIRELTVDELVGVIRRRGLEGEVFVRLAPRLAAGGGGVPS